MPSEGQAPWEPLPIDVRRRLLSELYQRLIARRLEAAQAAEERGLSHGSPRSAPPREDTPGART